MPPPPPPPLPPPRLVLVLLPEKLLLGPLLGPLPPSLIREGQLSDHFFASETDQTLVGKQVRGDGRRDRGRERGRRGHRQRRDGCVHPSRMWRLHDGYMT